MPISSGGSTYQILPTPGITNVTIPHIKHRGKTIKAGLQAAQIYELPFGTSKYSVWHVDHTFFFGQTSKNSYVTDSITVVS